MRQLLKRGPTAAETATSGASPAKHWQRVPKINLVSPQRGAPVGLLAKGIAVLLVVEIIVLAVVYRDLGAKRATVDEEGPRAAAVESQLSTKEQELEDLYTRRDEIVEGHQSLERAAEAVKSGQVEWGASLAALLGEEAPGVRFESVTAVPETGEVNVVGILEDENSLVMLDAHIEAVSDILEWKSSNVAQTDASLEFTATFGVRNASVGQ